MTATLTRRYRFCASHRLHSRHLDELENVRVYGKCNNPFGHGHDYALSVSVTGEIDPASGLLLPLLTLDNLVQLEILDQFDHRNLNSDIAEFAGLVPTTENLAVVIAERLRSRWRGAFGQSAFFPCSAWLSSISIDETERNSFTVMLAKPAAATTTSDELNESVIVNA